MSSMRWKRALGVIATTAIVCALVVVPLTGSAAGKKTAADGVKNFTILHTNDEHSEVIPYDLAMDYPNNPTTGGFSRLAKAISDIKTAKAAAGEPVLTFGSGDWSQGTLFSWLETSAAPELTLMQRMGYDAVTIGNHDIELGPAYLAAELSKARAAGVTLPVISSNITFSDTDSRDDTLKSFFSPTDQQRSNLYIQNYATKTLSNGLKVGMFGLLGVEAEAVAPGEAPVSFGSMKDDPLNPNNFVPRMTVAQSKIDYLRNVEHCDVVVCLSHMGTTEETNLADMVTGIDVIVGGHSHDLNYPPIIEGRGKTIIVQAKANTEYLGDLELQYDPSASGDNPKVAVRNDSVIRMNQDVGTVPAIDAVINNYITGLNSKLGFNCLAPFAETDLNKDGGFTLTDWPPMRETNLGDLITDTYKAAVNQVAPTPPTRIVIEANGVMRAGVPKGATGVFSFYDLYRSLPLGGSPYDLTTPGYPIVSFYLAGAEIAGVLEQLLVMNRNDFFIQTSGLKYTYDPNAPSGKKVKSLVVDNGAGGWDPIKPGSLYKLATNYYTGSFLVLFGLYPRMQNGQQVKPTISEPDPMKGFIIKTGATKELKAWQALTNTVGHMPDLDGDHIPNIPPTYYTTQGRVIGLPTAFYFAEGTCRPGFDPYICIQNPGSTDANVTITYMKGDNTEDIQNLTVAKNSRSTVNVKDKYGTGNSVSYDISARVQCTNSQPIIVERPMYFNYRPGDKNWNGGDDVVGALSPDTAFYFAEGTCRPGFDPYICVQNPTDEGASVKITYMKGDGTTATQSIGVIKNSRNTVRVKDTLGEGDDAAHDFSAKVESVPPQVGASPTSIIVERPMYFNYRGLTGGSDVVGATNPATVFYFAEGTCRPDFDPYICILNPIRADAKVKITYMKGDGSTAEQVLSVPKSSRATVLPRDVIGTGNDAAHDFSARVESINGVPIVAERPMYFNYKGKWNGGHDTVGATAPATSFFFAEGTCRPGFDPYICIQNPNGTDASVKITYMKGDGTTDTQDLTVAKNSRYTVAVKDKMGEGNDPAHDFSAKVECTSSQLIIVERPMYFDYSGGWTGGSCVVGCVP